MDDKNKGDDDSQATKGTARSTLGGAVAGAVAGTALGLPVVGTVIGAVSGAVIGAAKKRAAGTRQKAKSAKKATSNTKTSATKKRGRTPKRTTKSGSAAARKRPSKKTTSTRGRTPAKKTASKPRAKTSSRREVAEDRIWKGPKESSAPPGPEIGACNNGLSVASTRRPRPPAGPASDADGLCGHPDDTRILKDSKKREDLANQARMLK
jgi:hypothetical protein